MSCSAAGTVPPPEVTDDELAQLDSELAALQSRRERITQDNRQLRQTLRRAADEVPDPAPSQRKPARSRVALTQMFEACPISRQCCAHQHRPIAVRCKSAFPCNDRRARATRRSSSPRGAVCSSKAISAGAHTSATCSRSTRGGSSARPRRRRAWKRRRLQRGAHARRSWARACSRRWIR
jgi:hypothetical protein